ncbi:MAG: carbamoyltransferase [Bacteroidetes bacterium]|nr:carbamoyltransferase [Bacteroidota bacterium]
MSYTILGISAFYHDSAACIVHDGNIIAAAQEERFTRKKHDSNFPSLAVQFCLKEARCAIADVDAVVFYDKPFLKFNRLIETYLAHAPKGFKSFMMAIPIWLKEKLWLSDVIENELGYDGKILFTEHHESHAASAFFPSPFERAAIVTVDGVGEYSTTSIAIGKGNTVKILTEQHFPHSLGLLYSAFTYFTGFKVNSGEYKVMGLAPYGEPKYVQVIHDKLIDLREDGSFTLNLEYFNYPVGLTMTNNKMSSLFGGPPRKPETELTQREMDIAASIQAVTEEIMVRIVRYAKNITGEKNLCLAGGVALNCVANGKIYRSKIFDSLWIQPAAGDAGGALGAAFTAYYHYFKQPRITAKTDQQMGTYLGTKYSDAEIQQYLEMNGIPYIAIEDESELCNKVAELLMEEKVVGWFQGRMEFGPRALGNRSILGDARSPEMQKKINLKIKYRESFRPFAPAVLSEHVSDWFELDCESPYMLLVADVVKNKRRIMTEQESKLWGIDKLNTVRSEVPAVTHIDYSARSQTVHEETNPLFHKLLTTFFKKTGCPVIVNTSFNVRGEPIVESPKDAYTCFMRTDMDNLVIGKYLLNKRDQPSYTDDKKWKKEYALD